LRNQGVKSEAEESKAYFDVALDCAEEDVVANSNKKYNTKEPNILIIITIFYRVIQHWLQLPIILSQCARNPHMYEEYQESHGCNQPQNEVACVFKWLNLIPILCCHIQFSKVIFNQNAICFKFLLRL
jgi:hypothetical protein